MVYPDMELQELCGFPLSEVLHFQVDAHGICGCTRAFFVGRNEVFKLKFAWLPLLGPLSLSIKRLDIFDMAAPEAVFIALSFSMSKT